MNRQAFTDYLLAKPGASEGFPFGPEVKVFKVAGKMFATLSEDESTLSMNLKCDPDEALALRDIFSSILPGYHMNKRHWNTILLDGNVPEGQLKLMMDNSYLLVVAKLSKKLQSNLKQL